MCVIVISRKHKGRALKGHILKDMLPRGFDARIEEIQGKHQQAIEEKDAAFTHYENQIQAIQYENVALQAQRDVYQPKLKRYHHPS